MASRLFDDWELEAGLTEDGEGDLYDFDDNPVVLVTGDKLHFTLSKVRGGPALIDLMSDASPVGNSYIRIDSLGTAPAVPAHFSFRLSGADTPSFDGDYFAAIDLIDSGEPTSDQRKPVARGIFHFSQNPPQA